MIIGKFHLIQVKKRASVKLIFCLGTLLVLSTSPSCQEASEKTTPTSPMQWLTFTGQKDLHKAKKVVLISGDEEYRSEEVLPQLAKMLSTHHGFDCTVLFAQNPEHPGIIDPNYQQNIPGLEALEDADLMVLFTRFRDLPDAQMAFMQQYLEAGKPLIGIRTATHAFRIPDSASRWAHWGNYYSGPKADWKGGFGKMVLGANWMSHFGKHKHQSARGIIAPEAADHPLCNGITDGAIWGPSDVYEVPQPLPGDAQPIILGQVVDRAGEYDENDLLYGMKPTDQQVTNEILMPMIWTKSYQLPQGKKGNSITSTIGASADFLSEDLRRIWVNSVYYLLDLPVPEKAYTGFVGTFSPSQFKAYGDEYWDKKQLKVEDFRH
jgi:hypothetical protein